MYHGTSYKAIVFLRASNPQKNPQFISPPIEGGDFFRVRLNTIRGEVVLDRAFGMPADIVDMPIQKAQAALSSAIFTQIKRYEPRATVVQISFTGDVSGKLDPVVEVKIHETE